VTDTAMTVITAKARIARPTDPELRITATPSL
jgi:hypothetical protein